MSIKPTAPRFNLIEHVAAELAANFYEVGRSQGLKSRHKNARTYALNNLERFVPHATKYLLDQLNDPSISAEAKDEIMESLFERVNDPMAKSLADASANHALPDIDIAKLIPVKELPTVIHDKRAIADYEGARGLAFKRR
jgi:hypothetical protein